MAPVKQASTTAVDVPIPSSPAVTLAVIPLSLRLLTLVPIFISVIIIATNTMGGFKFGDFYAYRYMFASGVIGILYTFVQIGFIISHAYGNQIRGEAFALIDFYGDKALSYVLATGAAAGFGLTVDLNRETTDYATFLNKANASASLLFIGFLIAALSSVFSSFALPRRPT